MIRYKRRNTIWLAALAVLMSVLILSNSVSAEVQAFFFGLFVLAMAATFIDFSAGDQLVQTIQQRSPLNRTRMSADAREAAQRASSRPGYHTSGVKMIDVGLIASQSGRDGMVMRRTRSVSKDDDAVRPFVTLHVPTAEADRNVNLRFEIFDQNGRELYVHETQTFLRDGELNVLADHHLPLMRNDQVAGVGDWDLRVYMDNFLVGVHNFALTASNEERRRRLGGHSSGEYYEMGETRREVEPEPEERSLSLEELLRDQSRSQNNMSR
jgi:hypothetical protein